jgi:hypothetical protein
MTETIARSASAGKKRTVKKPKTTAKKTVKKTMRGGCCGNDDASPTTGGGFVDDLGKLSIPFGLVAANIGIKALYNKKKTGAAKAAPKRSASAGRRRMTGGAEGDDEKFEWCQSNTELKMKEKAPEPAAESPIPGQEGETVHGQAGGSRMLTGGALQQRQHHAMIAQEFRRMAHEIGSFLDGAARKNLAAKPKPAGSKIVPKKKPASAKKATK